MKPKTENLQLNESIKTSKEMTEEQKEACKKMREKHQALKWKYGELYDQVEHMSNPYARESKSAVIDRLKRFNDFVRDRLQGMM